MITRLSIALKLLSEAMNAVLVDFSRTHAKRINALWDSEQAK